MDKTTSDLIYLVSCAVNGRIPESVSSMDIEGIMKSARLHLLESAAAYSLESAGVKDPIVSQSINKSKRKAVILETEKALLFNRLESAGIWYMPLKGAVLKDYYPKLGMREMADYDILFDSSQAEDVKAIMESLGFTVERFDTLSNHDVYYKKPVTNFEMHRSLFRDFTFHETDRLTEYYFNIKERLVKDDSNNYGYHFTNEDFYVYLTAHEYKHYSRGGTGLRSLLDVYVYLKQFNEIDWKYIENETRKLEIEEFEFRNRNLALSLFDKYKSDDVEMLEYILNSGTYGTIDNFVGNRVKLAGNKAEYILRRLFLPMNTVKKAYPLFYRHKILLPLLPLYRLYLVRKNRRSNVKAELKALRKKRG